MKKIIFLTKRLLVDLLKKQNTSWKNKPIS